MTPPVIRVLVVDDDVDDAQHIRELLRAGVDASFDVRVVGGQAALEHVPGGSVDVIVLGFGLPADRGLDALRELRPRALRVPIIVLTAVADEALGTAAIRDGAQDCLITAETDATRLRRSIRYAIERKRAELAAVRALAEDDEERVAGRARELAVANDELIRHRRELKDFIDAMSTLNAKIAVDGTPLLVNRIAQQASGMSLERLMRTNFLDGGGWGFDPAVQDRVREAFRRATEGALVSYEERVFAFGKIITIHLTLAPVKRTDGTVEYIVAEGRDISRRVEVEEALKATNEELEAFTYSVSHDLRAPIRQMDGFSRLLGERLEPVLDAKARHYFGRIRESTQHMGRLVDDLLRLAQVGRQDMRPRLASLDAVLEDVLDDVRSDVAEREIEWRITPLPTVECDPGLMRVVFSNLVANAVKYTRPRRPAVIEVGQTSRSGRPTIFVRDNGVGFDMRYADRLFGVFQRLHRAEEFEGTGVGLATVQRIVHKHGGEIWAESSPGHGTTFCFTVGSALGGPGAAL
jgi:PAS domain S-box-containing protein